MMTERTARSLTRDDLDATGRRIRLTGEQDAAYSDRGPVGDAMRARIRALAESLSRDNGGSSVEVYGSEGDMYEQIAAAQ